jgi:nucleolar complex protein 2
VPPPCCAQAFLFIRQLALSLPPPALDVCLRGAYRAYVANARFVSAASAAHIHFMGACVVEMVGLDGDAG